MEKLNEILKLLNIAIVNCCQIEFSEALENGDLEEAKRCVVNFDITREKLCLADEMLSEIRKDKGGRP